MIDPNQAQLERLRRVAAAAPVLDAAAAQRADAARTLQIDAALRGAGPRAGVRQAQALAPAVAQAQGEAANAAAAGAAQTQLAVGQAGLGAQTASDQATIQRIATGQREQQAKAAATQGVAETAAGAALNKALTADEIASAQRTQRAGQAFEGQLSFLSRKQREDLARLGRDVKDELFDSRLRFETDELGRKFTNERQLADFAVASAQSDEQLKDRMQTMQQQADRAAYMVQRAFSLVQQDLDRQYRAAEQAKDHASKRRIIEMKRAMEKEAAEAQRKAANRSMWVQGVTTGTLVALTVATGGAAAPVAIAAGAGTAAIPLIANQVG